MEMPSNALVGPGRRIAGCLLRRVAGQGGMGVVFEATDPAGRIVAVKVLLPARAADPEAVDLFRAEARATAAVRHEGVVEILGCGAEDGVQYLVMEFVDGPPLGRVLADRGRLRWTAAARIAAGLADALGHAHGLGLLHRDVKPSNVLLTRDGRPKLIDFGIVKDIGTLRGYLVSGRRVGTAAYASPEQVEGRRLSPGTDIYSLGATLYHLLCGRPPFEGASPAEIARMQVADEPVPPHEAVPGLPRALSNLVVRMLAKKIADRPPDMRRVAEALRAALSGRVAILPAGARPRPRI